MKNSLFLSFLVLSLVFASCGSETTENTVENKKTTGIIGTWTLYKEIRNGKSVDYSGKPTSTELTFKENGYFIFFDKITDDEMANSGVQTIQDRYKGQFTLKDKELILNHFVSDSLISKNYLVKDLNDTELILVEKSGQHTQYFKR